MGERKLFLMLTLISEDIDIPQQVQLKNRSWSISDSSHLIFRPNSNDFANIFFYFNEFIELDLNAFVSSLKQSVHSRYPFVYDQIVLSLNFVFEESEKTPDVNAMISNINEFFVRLQDPYIKYVESNKIKEVEIPQSFSINSTPKKEKKEKKLKFDKEKDKKQKESKVWKSIDEKDRKKLFGQFGYLATSDKKNVLHDAEIISNFIDSFIHDNSKFAKKFKSELQKRWLATFVRLIE